MGVFNGTLPGMQEKNLITKPAVNASNYAIIPKLKQVNIAAEIVSYPSEKDVQSYCIKLTNV